MYIYIYIYREREIHIYIYIYMCRAPAEEAARSEDLGRTVTQVGSRCQGRQMSTKVVNSGFNNSAGIQWPPSGSRVARGCKIWFEIRALFVLPTFRQGRNPAEILNPPPCKHISGTTQITPTPSDMFRI